MGSSFYSPRKFLILEACFLLICCPMSMGFDLMFSEVENKDIVRERWKTQWAATEQYQIIPEEKFFVDVLDDLIEYQQQFPSELLSMECIDDLYRIQNASRTDNLRYANQETELTPDEQLYLTMEYSSGALTRRLFHSGYLEAAGNVPMCVAIDHQIKGSDNKTRRVHGKVFKAKVGEFCFFDGHPAPASMIVCLPSSCNQKGLWKITHHAALTRNSSGNRMYTCSIRDINFDLRPAGQGYENMCYFLFGIAMLCMCSGLIDCLYGAWKKPRCFLLEIFFAFSVYRNVKYIFEPEETKKGYIATLNSLRALSMLWIIAGHLSMVFYVQEISDLRLGGEFYAIPMEFLSNAFFAVDTFFFISGLLVVYTWFIKYKRNPRMLSCKEWIIFYINRIFRLTPPYYVMLFIYTYMLMELFRDKPNTMHTRYDIVPCPETYHLNLLYIQNYVYAPGKHGCFDSSWYLAADMQMFIFTPPILFLLARYPCLGHIVIGVLIGLSTIANFLTVSYLHYPEGASPQTLTDPLETEAKDYSRYIYNASHIRCQIYLMGMVVGYLLHVIPLRKPRIGLRLLIVFLWPLALLCMAWIIVTFYPYHRTELAPVFLRATYSALSRIVWGLGLTFIVLACHYGYGGPIDSFLSWHVWAPLGRLTFSTYLVHSALVKYIMGISEEPIRYMGMQRELFFRFVPISCLAFGIAIFYSAFYELPFTKLGIIITSLLGSKVAPGLLAQAEKKSVDDNDASSSTTDSSRSSTRTSSASSSSSDSDD